MHRHSGHRIKGEDIDVAINTTMKLVEAENGKFKDVLPKNYTHINDTTIIEMVCIPSTIPTIEDDAFGKTYEFFLVKFAMKKGRTAESSSTPRQVMS